MLSKKNKIKIVSLLALIFQLLFLNSTFVFAQNPPGTFDEGTGSLPDPTSVGDQISNDMTDKYNINSDSIKNMMQGFNVSSNKLHTPEVSLLFNPSEPKEGEKITAKALPMYFSNPKEELYFTWYLVRKDGNIDCGELTDNPSSAKEELCDADGNGEIQVNDWKVAAMRLIATQGYNNQDEPMPNYSIDGDNDEYKAYFGGGDKGAAGDTNKYCYIYNAEEGTARELPACDHLFSSTNGNGTPGDNSFGHEEEEFWGTNPQDPNTAGNGNMDEANVVGRGQDTFSWTYLTDDRVGVAVEGTSTIATKYDDASYMIMWAFPKNKFNINGTGTRLYCQPAPNATNKHNPLCAAANGFPPYDEEDGPVTTGFFDVIIPTANNTLEEAFEDNLVDPAEKTNQKLDVSLSYSPENPMNDTSSDNLGDLLSVSSSISNTSQNDSQIHYDWNISAGTSIAGNFHPITGDLNKDGLIEGKISGINNSKIAISLNLGGDYRNFFDDDGIGYLKIRVQAKESTPERTKIGYGETIIRINSTGNRVRAYLTSSLDGNSLSRGSLICNTTATPGDRMNYYICPVVRNQILRLEVNGDGMSDFSWNVNGANITCDSSLSADCSGGNIVFLPILGAVGDELNVRMNAKNIENGRGVEISRKFQIVTPYVKIFSNDADTFWPKLLGTYSDLDGNQYPDYSDSLFETYTGANASLTAEFHPTWLQEAGILNSMWTLDGQENTNAAAPAVIDFVVTKNIGEVHNATFNSFFVATNEIRKVLLNYWGVTQAQSSGKLISSSVSGEVIPDNSSGALSFKSPTKFLASIISNLSGQTLFLLRTVLVVFMMVLISGLAMNFSPDFGKNKQ